MKSWKTRGMCFFVIDCTSENRLKLGTIFLNLYSKRVKAVLAFFFCIMHRIQIKTRRKSEIEREIQGIHVAYLCCILIQNYLTGKQKSVGSVRYCSFYCIWKFWTEERQKFNYQSSKKTFCIFSLTKGTSFYDFFWSWLNIWVHCVQAIRSDRMQKHFFDPRYNFKEWVPWSILFPID